MDLNVAETVERLYTAPPEQFIASRSEAVAQARAAGDRALAERIGRLRKPSLAAWMVNLLAHRRPDLIDDLLAVGAELRAAQRELRGAELRELSARRRDTVAALAREARGLALAAGRSAGEKLPLVDVEKTLAAALSDEALAAEVRAGQLVKSLDYAGFGETPRPQLRLVRGGDEPQTGEPHSGEPQAGKTHGSRNTHGSGKAHGANETQTADETQTAGETHTAAGLDEQALAAARTRRKERAAEIKAARRALLETSARLANAQAAARNAQTAVRLAVAKADEANALVDKLQEQVDGARAQLDALHEEDLAP